MTEDFLCYIWKTKQFLRSDRPLYTVCGLGIDIVNVGYRNRDSGPDFTDVSIKVDNMLWCGSVEIHVKSSEWYAHKHDSDPAYNSVVLHVVYKHDKETYGENGQHIYTLDLSKYINIEAYQEYIDILDAKFSANSFILCSSLWNKVDKRVFLSWKETLLFKRLERKKTAIHQLLKVKNHDWEEVFYIKLAGSLGMSINTAPMEALANKIPLKYLRREAISKERIEAFLLSVAGFLLFDDENIIQDEYVKQLLIEQRFLDIKYGISPLPSSYWKYSKTYPTNFPDIRIVQLANIICKENHLFNYLLEIRDKKELYDFFSIPLHSYWDTHYRLEKASVHKEKNIGKVLINNLIINLIVPFLFAYSEIETKSQYREKAFFLLENLRSEQNYITRSWSQLNLDIKTAFDSQALIELTNNFCKKKRCLDCKIGHNILQQ